MTADLDGMLRRLHLPTVRRLHGELALRAEEEGMGYRSYLEILVSEEIAHRAQTRITRSARGGQSLEKNADIFLRTHRREPGQVGSRIQWDQVVRIPTALEDRDQPARMGEDFGIHVCRRLEAHRPHDRRRRVRPDLARHAPRRDREDPVQRSRIQGAEAAWSHRRPGPSTHRPFRSARQVAAARSGKRKGRGGDSPRPFRAPGGIPLRDPLPTPSIATPDLRQLR
jgi:hypothetical protein